MGRKTGVAWKAYRFDGQGKYFKKDQWDLTEDTGNHFCWYHGELPKRRNLKLESIEKIFTKKLCPPLKQKDITRMVSGGPFCDHVDGALFLRVYSSGPLSSVGPRLAARITENSMITMSLGPNLELGVFPENQSLVRNDKMVELDEIRIEKADKNGIEEEDVESRLERNKEEAGNPLVTVGSLLIHIVKRHVDYLQKLVTELEIESGAIDESTEIGGGNRRLGLLHLSLQQLLQVIGSLKFKSRPYICLVLNLLMIFVHVAIQVIFPHMEQVFPRIEENFSKKGWLIPPDDVRDLQATINRLGRLKENVGFIGSWVATIKAEFDSRQTTQINQKLYCLSILSLFLLPLSFVTGIFGLSVGGIPWTGHKDGFHNVLLICVVMTVVLLAFFAYRRIIKIGFRLIYWIKAHLDA